MPQNKYALSRYRLIDERLRNKQLPPPSVADLMELVAERMDRSVSRRTILLDLQNMRESADLKYYAPIAYDNYRGGYYYAEEGYSINNVPVTEYELQGLEIAIGMLQQFQRLPVIRQFEDAILKIADAVSIDREHLVARGLLHLDTAPQFQGLKWLPEIAMAIKDREVLRIRYQAFNQDAPREYRIEPYHLREYNNRFYVFARSLRGEGTGLRTFGLDRIQELWNTNEHYDEQHFDESSYFRHAIGITVPEEEPRRIVLSFTPQQGHYVKTSPLHESQRVLVDDDNEYRVELLLVINPELLMLLLSYGARVRVLEPQDLADRIRQEARDILARYGEPASKPPSP